MYVCPHCNQPGISALRRSFLGPRFPATCKQCGGKIGVPDAQSFLATIPFLLSILVAPLASTFAHSFLTALIGAVAMFVLHFKFVPLVKR